RIVDRHVDPVGTGGAEEAPRSERHPDQVVEVATAEQVLGGPAEEHAREGNGRFGLGGLDRDGHPIGDEIDGVVRVADPALDRFRGVAHAVGARVRPDWVNRETILPESAPERYSEARYGTGAVSGAGTPRARSPRRSAPPPAARRRGRRPAAAGTSPAGYSVPSATCYLGSMRFVHVADVHLDSSFAGRSDEVRQRLRSA